MRRCELKKMMSIKKKRKERTSNNNYPPHTNNDDNNTATLRQQIKELIDIIGHREDQLYRDGCLEDICKVLERHLDIKINHWIQSFEHHRLKEEEWKARMNWEFMDLHHSMKVYSNGAAHGLQFFKDELR